MGAVVSVVVLQLLAALIASLPHMEYTLRDISVFDYGPNTVMITVEHHEALQRETETALVDLRLQVSLLCFLRMLFIYSIRGYCS